ncbi:MAG: hypothetical protein ABIG63_07930 [Chloroflexota bacterium]
MFITNRLTNPPHLPIPPSPRPLPLPRPPAPLHPSAFENASKIASWECRPASPCAIVADPPPRPPSVAIARRLLVTVWYVLTKREPYHHFDEETIAYKMLTWSQRMDEKALKGMTR